MPSHPVSYNLRGWRITPPEQLKNITDHIPAKRLGTVDEVANICLYLSSPMADYITGETLYIDGGQRLWGDNFLLA